MLIFHKYKKIKKKKYNSRSDLSRLSIENEPLNIPDAFWGPYPVLTWECHGSPKEGEFLTMIGC